MDLARVAPAFVEMAHRIVWATVATVDPEGRPRTRILHPIWEWDGSSLVGWIATGPDSPKAAHLASTPLVSLTYWDPTHDTCTADAEASIVAAVIGVSRRLRLRVAADGVDSREQFEFLKQHGCDEGQGAYFGGAVDPERFATLLSQNVDTAGLRNM